MKLSIQTPHFEPGKQVLNFAEEHIIKLQYLSDRIVEAQACLKLDRSDKKEDKICEIKLVIPGHDIFVLKQGNTFEDAILQAVSALKHQLERWSTSYKEHAENT